LGARGQPETNIIILFSERIKRKLLQ